MPGCSFCDYGTCDSCVADRYRTELTALRRIRDLVRERIEIEERWPRIGCVERDRLDVINGLLADAMKGEPPRRPVKEVLLEVFELRRIRDAVKAWGHARLTYLVNTRALQDDARAMSDDDWADHHDGKAMHAAAVAQEAVAKIADDLADAVKGAGG